MKKNDEFIVEIIDLSSDGYGVAKVDGEIVFVPNAITNEKVKIKIINTKTKFAIAKVLEYYTQSEFRTIPKCKYFGKCGGCDLQHIKYEKQLEFKTNQVKNCFNKYANINLQVDNCVASSNIFNYRNKIAIPVVEENGETIIGLYKVGSHNVVEIEDCVIQKPFVSKLLKIIKSYINKNNLKGYNEVSKSGDIKHIVARYLQNKLLVTVVTTKKTLPNLNELYKDLVNEFKEVGLNLNINNLNNNVILSDKYVHINGIKELNITEFGTNFNVNANSFYQVNDEVKNKIYERVCNLCKNAEVVIDAYSGAGLLTSIISKHCKKVYGIEIVESATKNANELMKINNIKNVENINGDCAKVVPKLVKTLNAKNLTVVLDPPRKGCDEKVLKAIMESGIDKIVYISCNPSTLARDVKFLTKDNDYSVTSVTPYDMFPQTKHVETLAVINKVN